MRTSHYPSLKTVNIDSDIFTQESPPARSKLPLQLLKSLAQRKRNSKKNYGMGERYKFSFSKTKPSTANQQNQTFLNEPTPLPKAVEQFSSKRHSKTKPQVARSNQFNVTDYSIPHQKQQSFHNRRESDYEEISPNETKQNLAERQQPSISEHLLQYQYIGHNSGKINPYTLQQYTYLTNKEYDQLCQIKKSTRFRKISTITHSYKVATIELAPHMQQRKRSVNYSPIKTYTPTKQVSNRRKSMMKNVMEGSTSPSPWEWGMYESKDDLQ